MDEPFPPAEAGGLPLIGPHLRLHAEVELPPDFFPLRLVLQQTGAAIDVNRADTLIGRHSEADVRLPLPDVSRRHCRLIFAEGGWHVIDLNSLNGVHLNGQAVLHAPLAQNDQVRIGGFILLVDLAPTVALDPAGHVQSILRTLTEARRQAS